MKFSLCVVIYELSSKYIRIWLIPIKWRHAAFSNDCTWRSSKTAQNTIRMRYDSAKRKILVARMSSILPLCGLDRTSSLFCTEVVYWFNIRQSYTDKHCEAILPSAGRCVYHVSVTVESGLCACKYNQYITSCWNNAGVCVKDALQQLCPKVTNQGEQKRRTRSESGLFVWHPSIFLLVYPIQDCLTYSQSYFTCS